MTVLCSGTATGFAATALAAGSGPAEVLGSFPTACYLRLPGSSRLTGGTVIALLSTDAVQLPIGITLAWSSAELPLHTLGQGARVGRDELWLGRLRVTVTDRRDARLAYCGQPVHEPPRLRLTDPFALPPAAAVAALLGRGPGLTPAGDDLLCGALAAQVLFGLPDAGLAAAVTERLADPRATPELSRQLLLRAVAGDGLPQLQDLGHALCRSDRAALAHSWARLLQIGHSSGAALAAGLVAGARHARERIAA